MEWHDEVTDDVRGLLGSEVAAVRAITDCELPQGTTADQYEAWILDVLADLEPRTLTSIFCPPGKLRVPIDDAVEPALRLVEDGDLEYIAMDGGVLFRLGNGRRDAEGLLRDDYSYAEAVRTLTAMGHRPHAEKLWRATLRANASKEDSMSTATEPSDEKTPKRRSRAARPANGTPAASGSGKKKGRKPKVGSVAMDLYLARGRVASLVLPDDVDQPDLQAIGEQLGAFMSLREVQKKAREGA